MRSFKRFLKTVGLFLLIVSLLSGFFIGCYLEGENFHYQDAREREALSGKLDFLLCGASYTLFGMRSDILTEKMGVSAYSLAGTLLTLRGRYELLQQELARNQVDIVVLEVSPDTLLRDRAEEGPKGDLPMLGRITDPRERWRYFREAFTVSEWPEVYYDLVSKGMDSALRLLNGTYTTENQITVRGYYDNKNPQKYIPNNYAEIYNVHTLPEQVNPENVAWLEKLVELCREYGATPYLITAPQSKYYNCVYSNLDYYENWYKTFAAEHHLAYYNFNLAKDKLKLLPDETCFYDETHLNPQGGEIFTRMLLDIIYHHQQGRDNGFYFFDSYEQLTWASDYFD